MEPFFVLLVNQKLLTFNLSFLDTNTDSVRVESSIQSVLLEKSSGHYLIIMLFFSHPSSYFQGPEGLRFKYLSEGDGVEVIHASTCPSIHPSSIHWNSLQVTHEQSGGLGMLSPPPHS